MQEQTRALTEKSIADALTSMAQVYAPREESTSRVCVCVYPPCEYVLSAEGGNSQDHNKTGGNTGHSRGRAVKGGGGGGGEVL